MDSPALPAPSNAIGTDTIVNHDGTYNWWGIGMATLVVIYLVYQTVQAHKSIVAMTKVDEGQNKDIQELKANLTSLMGANYRILS